MKESDIILSIIIPVYNVGNYVQDCISSVIGIKRKNIEIIIVDDGSTDDSLDKIASFKDDRIIIIKKKNSGYGDTMNIGIENASGKYVAFLESDDTVVDGAYEKLLETAIRCEAEVVRGNYNLWENSRIKYFENYKDLLYDEKIINKEKLFFTAPAIWSGIYKREFLLKNEISFLTTPGASYQDTSYAFKIWTMAERIYLIDTPVVNYRIDSCNSSSNSSSKIFNIRDEYKEIERYLRERDISKYWAEYFKCKHISYMWNIGRLSPDNKMKFLMAVQTEYIDAFHKGYFNREIWNDYDWEIIHLIVFNIKLAWRELYVGDLSVQKQNEIVDCMHNLERVCVYEKDAQREQIIKDLTNLGINNSVVVKSIEDNKDDIVLITEDDGEYHNNTLVYERLKYL